MSNTLKTSMIEHPFVRSPLLGRQGLLLSVMIQLTGATLFGFIIAATRRIVQFIAPIQKATAANIQVDTL